MPTDRFDEIPLKANRGDLITITGYYGAKSSLKSVKYPLRMDFEVLKWPTTTNLRSFAYSFTNHWLDSLILPLQSSDMKWHKLTIKLVSSGQDFLVPLVGKYGHYQGAHTPDKLFGINLISSNDSKAHHVFKLRGVADAYESFDRPKEEDSHLSESTHSLENALVSPFSLGTPKDSNAQETTLLRYVKLAAPSGKGLPPGPKKKARVSTIHFTAALCVGFL